MRKQYALDSQWLFGKAEENASRETVDLPHTWNKDLDVQRGKYLYEKVLKAPEAHRGEPMFLEFLGADTVCEVFLNDQLVGIHRGGYSAFRFEITELYDWSIENHLKVYVDNSPTPDVSPLNGDFTIYGGLYRSVNLICVPDSHFDLLFYGSSGVLIQSEVDETGNGLVKIDAYVVNPQGLSVDMKIRDREGSVVARNIVDAASVSWEMEVPNCKKWNGKEDPYLYSGSATLRSEHTVYDEVTINFGFRSCRLDPEKGFALNRKQLRIHGVAKHQDRQGVGNAITSEHLREDFALIDEIGANGVRLSHYQHNQETYDLCDQKGYVTWAEIPMMSMPERPGVLENAKEQLKELIYQNMHHPSICMWGIQNEIAMDGESLFMYQGVDELNSLLHTLIPAGISASANMYYVKNESPLNFISDLLGYNLYYGWYYGEIEDFDAWIDGFHEENPQVVLGISEYGADCNLKFHSDAPRVKDYSEEFQAMFHEKTYQIIESKHFLWGSFVWNMFDFGSFVRDEGGTKGKNAKGLVTFDRKTRKDAFYFYKAKWSDQPFVHLCEKRFAVRDKNSIHVKVYSNLKEITLHVNGDKVAVQSGQGVFRFADVPLEMGDNTISVSGGMGCTEWKDEAVFVRKKEREEAYVYEDPNPGVNVENWFVQGKGELDYFPKGCFSIRDKLGDLMENEAAWEILKEKAPKIVERTAPGAPVTLLWVFNKMRSHFSEDDIREINSMLTKIKK